MPTVKVELSPMRVPNYILIENKLNDFEGMETPKISIEKLDSHAAQELLNQFINDFWAKVGRQKRPPSIT